MQDLDPVETQEWLDSLESVLDKEGEDRAHYLLTYYPEQRADEDGEGRDDETVPRWRPIEVRVNRPGLVARTLAGYEKL